MGCFGGALMLRLNDIWIKRTPIAGTGAFVLHIDAKTIHGDLQFSGYFDDFGGFLTAVKDAAVFFTARMGRIPAADANRKLLTRPIVVNPDSKVS